MHNKCVNNKRLLRQPHALSFDIKLISMSKVVPLRSIVHTESFSGIFKRYKIIFIYNYLYLFSFDSDEQKLHSRSSCFRYAIHFIAKLILSIVTNKKNMTFFTLAFRKIKALSTWFYQDTIIKWNYHKNPQLKFTQKLTIKHFDMQ